MKPVASNLPALMARAQADRIWRLALLVFSMALFVIAVGLAAAGVHALLAVGLVGAAVVGLGGALNVPLLPRSIDVEAGRRLMAAAGDPMMQRPCEFDDEVRVAYLVQQAVFDVAPFEKRDPEGRKVSLPLGNRRELSDLVQARTGHCFDRSRAIETLLRMYGLKARHVAIFARAGSESWLRTLMRRGTPSHSVTEVKTRRGWMTIDSNFRFIGLSESGDAFDMRKLLALPEVDWDPRNREVPPKLGAPFVYIYGLYSRHGRFYPPYIRFPNVNWRELTYNLLR